MAEYMMGLTGQVRFAFEQSGLSVGKLLNLSGLSLDRSSLHRKLKGKLRVTTDEVEALARALCIDLIYLTSGLTPALAKAARKRRGA